MKNLIDIHFPDSRGEDIFIQVHRDLYDDPEFDIEGYKRMCAERVEAARYGDSC